MKIQSKNRTIGRFLKTARIGYHGRIGTHERVSPYYEGDERSGRRVGPPGRGRKQ